MSTTIKYRIFPSVLDAARAYLKAGWSPVPIPHGSKGPVVKNWSDLRVTENDLPAYFHDGESVGILLGEPSGGLVDVDLDSPETRALAGILLPSTDAVFGRPSSPRSHRLYRCDPAPRSKSSFIDPITTKKIVELRSTGLQTVFPPSEWTDESAGSRETRTWEADGEPFQITKDDLQKAVSRLAAAALLSRYWPRENGCRQDIAMSLAGGLLRAGWRTAEVERFIRAVAEAAGDEEAAKREAAVGYTEERLDGDRPATSWTRLKDLIDPRVVERVREWLDLKSREDDGPVIVTFANIKSEPVRWIRPGVYPGGKVSMNVGNPGLGKSLLGLDMAARISTGADWPEGGSAPLGHTILLCVEDGLRDTVQPRLAAMGADLTKIHAITAVRKRGEERLLDLAKDLQHLEAAIRRFSPVVAVIIDPVTGYIGESIDTHRDASTRRVLDALSGLAEKHDVAIIGIAHLNKSALQQAIYRVGGSIAFVAVPRSVFAVVPDPDDIMEERRFFVRIKGNLSAQPPALAFSVTEREGAAIIAWEKEPVGTVDLDAALGAITEDKDDRAERQGAEAWLKDFLREPRLRNDIEAAAKGAGVSWRAVERARARCGGQITVEPQDGKFGSPWVWRFTETSSTRPPTPPVSGGHGRGRRGRRTWGKVRHPYPGRRCETAFRDRQDRQDRRVRQSQRKWRSRRSRTAEVPDDPRKRRNESPCRASRRIGRAVTRPGGERHHPGEPPGIPGGS